MSQFLVHFTVTQTKVAMLFIDNKIKSNHQSVVIKRNQITIKLERKTSLTK